MLTPAYLDKRPDGLYLIDFTTAEVIFGPCDTEATAEELASDLGVEIRPRGVKASNTIAAMIPGSLFRIKAYWYRLKKHEGRESILDVVGEGREERLPKNTVISEVSVLSKK